MTNKIYIANTGRCGSSFIAYALGQSSKIFGAHQPKVNTHPLMWNTADNVLHELGDLWLKDKNEFLSLTRDKVKKGSKLHKVLKMRDAYVNKYKNKIYAESANNLFPLMNVYKEPGTKFIHLIREPVEWCKRNLPMYSPGTLPKRLDRNPSFVKGENDLEYMANIWLHINAMIDDISDANPDNWFVLKTSDFVKTPQQSFEAMYKFLDIPMPKVDYAALSKGSAKNVSKPNDTFKKRAVKNSHDKERKYGKHYTHLFENDNYITDITHGLWDKVNNKHKKQYGK